VCTLITIFVQTESSYRPAFCFHYTVAPTISNPPEDAVVKVGETATFRCVGSGIPTPTVGWYDERGNLLANGTTLTRENVQSTGRNPTFICIVSSDAGRAQKLVKLTVYGELG
jgi:hypothetical protein